MNYSIDIKSLAPGRSSFEYKIDNSFFKAFGNDMIKDAALDLRVDFDKASGWIGVLCSISGQVVVECDRCLSDLSLPVNISAPLTVKFSSVGADEDQADSDIIVLDKNEGELDLSQVVYDYVCLSIPLKKVHPDGECDPVMMKKMEELLK